METYGALSVSAMIQVPAGTEHVKAEPLYCRPWIAGADLLRPVRVDQHARAPQSPGDTWLRAGRVSETVYVPADYWVPRTLLRGRQPTHAWLLLFAAAGWQICSRNGARMAGWRGHADPSGRISSVFFFFAGRISSADDRGANDDT